jgi:pescadillo protein
MQVAPPDVDFRIMLTFLEFYETLLKFVLFKLYHQQDLAYPPVRTSTHQTPTQCNL